MSGAVLITGGSRGIGAACVRAFAQGGRAVGFTYHTNASQANQVAAQTGALAVCADAADAHAVAHAVEQVSRQCGTIDTLVCNAGVSSFGLFQDLSDKDWNDMMQVNVLGAVRAIRAVLPAMLHHKQGSIVLVSSVWGRVGAACESHYAASKAALIGLGKSLAHELGPSGIRVNIVAPGVIDTDMNAVHSADTLRDLADQTPLGRMGSADEVAQAVLWLSSACASFVTGEVLGISGGFA